MRVLAFVGRRLARLVLSLVAVSIITFGLLQLAPGDFASIQAVGGGDVGLDGSVKAESYHEIEQRYGAEVPVWLQYLRFMKGVVTLDIGPSYKYPHLTVEGIILHAFPVSFSLALLATALALLVAIPLGALAAVKRGTFWDNGPMFLAALGHGIPNYLAALVLVLVLSAQLRLLPSYGWEGPQSMVLPVLALAASPIAVLAKYVRNSMLENLREEYVVAALAKGGGRFRTVLWRHVLRNSLIPLVTVSGPMFAALATGTIFVEKIFGIPGLGQYFTDAAAARDMPLLMGTTLFFAALLMVINLLVDLSYAVLDPRVRIELGLVESEVSESDVAGDHPAGAADEPGARAPRADVLRPL